MALGVQATATPEPVDDSVSSVESALFTCAWSQCGHEVPAPVFLYEGPEIFPSASCYEQGPHLPCAPQALPCFRKQEHS